MNIEWVDSYDFKMHIYIYIYIYIYKYWTVGCWAYATIGLWAKEVNLSLTSISN